MASNFITLPFSLSFKQTNKIARVVEDAVPFLLQEQFAQLQDGQLLILANSNNQADYLYGFLKDLADKEYNVFYCPDWGTLAYDRFSPSAQIISERISFLEALGSGVPGIYILSLTTALHKLPPASSFVNVTNYRAGQERSLEQVRQDLLDAGYSEVDLVYEPGEFSQARRQISFFPMGAEFPYRLDFFENTIDRIRSYTTEERQNFVNVQSININPGSEFPSSKVARKNFAQKFLDYFGSIPVDVNSIYALITENEGPLPQGSQYYLPLFYEAPLSSLADYLKGQVQVVYFTGYQGVGEFFAAENERRYQDRVDNRLWPPVKVEDLYFNTEQLLEQLRAKANLIEYEDYFTSMSHLAQGQELKGQELEHTSPFLPLDNLLQSYVQNSVGTKEEVKLEAQPNVQKLITLGLNRQNQPIIGDLTLKSLENINALALRNLFAPKVTENHPLYKLVSFIRKLRANFSNVHITVSAGNKGRLNSFIDLLEDIPLKFIEPQEKYTLAQQFANTYKKQVVSSRGNKEYNRLQNSDPAAVANPVVFSCLISSLKSGFAYYDESKKTAYIILSEQDVVGSFVTRSRTLARIKQKNANQVIQGLLELHEGQLLVHENHGICRYLGLKTYEFTPDFPQDMLELEFADTNLFVPVKDLHLLSSYGQQHVGDVPRELLSAVSGRKAKRWLKSREKALESIRDMAAKLLDLESRRMVEKGIVYTIFEQEYQEFVSQFRYEETPDQYATIQQVLDDMSSDKKMDRLICGDVGFGKTEVAMRAAFVAITNAKQVAILVPTTLLAQQHYESFRDRFAATGANVEILSRFNTATTNNRIIERLEQGLVDIIIGTHALLKKRVKFKDLGLLIIDEEHQFGVRQKEQLKQMRANVEVITMTATPIPRTLNLALNGFRDISLISTAPPNRLSIITSLYESDKTEVVKDAIAREIQRGGQVFFIHNDVGSIEAVANRIRELVPHARVGVGHGKMAKSQLEEVMMSFHNQRFNVLVCTTIVETGIDVPNANTIIINNAQNFGLAQLHQLRGRVGRSFRQAYAYLLVPDLNHMTTEARLRLKSLTDIDSLGAGYILATHDLEIRGAGEVLGEGQSGKIDEIGYTLYMSMLQNAVKQLRNNKELDIDSIMSKRLEIDLDIPSLIPSSYIESANLRVFYYRQIDNASSEFQLEEIANSIIENHGPLPTPLRTMFMMHKLRLHYQDAGLKSIVLSRGAATITWESTDKLNVDQAFKLVSTYPEVFRVTQDSLVINKFKGDELEVMKTINKVLGIIVDESKIKTNSQPELADAARVYRRTSKGQRVVNQGAAQFASQINQAQLSPEELENEQEFRAKLDRQAREIKFEMETAVFQDSQNRALENIDGQIEQLARQEFEQEHSKRLVKLKPSQLEKAQLHKQAKELAEDKA
ncbi:transcription-repair coupling factor [Psittacicella melopsittaci]|uniref:Transcription-repair-coupling factor n=1 Tax=Psittacicella melopsittaci TaxID=2028576 RepID=A0A3A1Y555_9GAMM|nr:transcription-repair coupling factor [Psittacicella melopsittaci]RIY33383.1 transcription-repair coupling factor [Psittacicella melopsittaci]